jgi:hypothetical protein
MAHAVQTPAVSFNTIKAEATQTMNINNAASSSINAVAMAPQRKTSRRKSLGQGMTEYIVIVALVGVAAIGTYSFLGGTIRSQTAGIAQELAGQSAKDAITKAQGHADKALKNETGDKKLGSYQNN